MRPFILFCMIAMLGCSESDDGYGTKIAPFRYLRSFEFEGHSYIYLRNTCNSAGDQLLHDPGCKCRNEGVK